VGDQKGRRGQKEEAGPGMISGSVEKVYGGGRSFGKGKRTKHGGIYVDLRSKITRLGEGLAINWEISLLRKH